MVSCWDCCSECDGWMNEYTIIYGVILIGKPTNKQILIESLLFFVNTCVKFSVLFYWQVGSQFCYEQSSSWETDSRTLTQGILLSARNPQLITALPMARSPATAHCSALHRHSAQLHVRECWHIPVVVTTARQQQTAYVNSYVFVTSLQSETGWTFTGKLILSTDLKKRRNTPSFWPMGGDKMESRKSQLA